FCGALFHAFCVAHALNTGEAPAPADWSAFAHNLAIIEDIVRADDRLHQGRSGSLGDALMAEIALAEHLIRRVGSPTDYEQVLIATSGFDSQTRAAGLNTAIAAAALAHVGRTRSIEETLLLAANAVGSDTDTIGSMAGAIIGATQTRLPDWPVQD